MDRLVYRKYPKMAGLLVAQVRWSPHKFFPGPGTLKKYKYIMNYNKADSMFNYGMKVSVYTEKKADKKNVGWHKGCEDIRYF